MRVLFGLLALGAPLVGCTVNHCDPGQRYWDGFCLKPDAGAADASWPEDDGGAAADCPSPGGACTDSADCDCEAGWCAIEPGETTGYCTRTGCLETPDVCPDGWGCMDLSRFSPALPAICTRP
jgi:hypothetical protein